MSPQTSSGWGCGAPRAGRFWSHASLTYYYGFDLSHLKMPRAAASSSPADSTTLLQSMMAGSGTLRPRERTCGSRRQRCALCGVGANYSSIYFSICATLYSLMPRAAASSSPADSTTHQNRMACWPRAAARASASPCGIGRGSGCGRGWVGVRVMCQDEGEGGNAGEG